MIIIVFILVIGVFEFVSHHQALAISEVKAIHSNLCLDDYHNNLLTNNVVDSWRCNDTEAQNWVVSYNSIKHSGNYCLSVLNSATSQGSKVVLNNCDQSAGQVWLLSSSKYENPNSGLCLNIPNNSSASQLNIESCSGNSDQLSWSTINTSNAKSYSLSCSGLTAQGELVACNAALQWDIWQSANSSHTNLLNNYSDDNSYEEWCADFVSYVYQQAGYPFSQGERNGWDEYNANNIQYMGFTLHSVSSGYVPQPGDVAYFNYNDGHVEIVVSGGTHPSFIYGDSGQTDPATGNGNMATNTLTAYSGEGELQYYLSPN